MVESERDSRKSLFVIGLNRLMCVDSGSYPRGKRSWRLVKRRYLSRQVPVFPAPLADRRQRGA